MKKRIVILVVAIVLIMVYNQLSSDVSDFSYEDLRKIRPMGHIVSIENYNDNALVFWGDLGCDYFKPTPFGFKWVYGGTHSGDYDDVSSQYLPKAHLKDFAIVFGRIYNPNIDTIKLTYDQNSITAEIIETEEMILWYVILEKEQFIFDIECYNQDVLIKTKTIDESWMANP